MRMTFGDLILAVARLSDDTSLVGKDTAARRINDISDKVSRCHIWSFFKEISESITLTAGIYSYETPATMKDVNFVFYLDTSKVKRFVDPANDKDFFERVITGNEAYYDSPRLYRLTGMGSNRRLKLEIGPPPSAAHISTYGPTLYLEQCKRPTILQNTAADWEKYLDWPDEFYMMIEYGAAALVCAGQPDAAKASGFGTIYESERKSLVADDIMRHGGVTPLKPAAGATMYPWRTGCSGRRRYR